MMSYPLSICGTIFIDCLSLIHYKHFSTKKLLPKFFQDCQVFPKFQAFLVFCKEMHARIVIRLPLWMGAPGNETW